MFGAKERLLGDENTDRLPINILGWGRSVVGQMLSSELARDEVAELITSGFLPLTAPDEMPMRTRAAGLREIGLPYATDPAITKHLAAFLTSRAAMKGQSIPASRKSRSLIDGKAGRGSLQWRLLHSCNRAGANHRGHCQLVWRNGGGWRPKILSNEAMSSAVAIGAAYYGRVRRGAGLRVKAGSARTYYIGMRSEGTRRFAYCRPERTRARHCVLDREFSVLANRPVSFHLFSSTVRHDAHGALADLDPAEVHRHAPLVTLLRYGKKLQQMDLAVRLSVSFTEVGTLELWCESRELAAPMAASVRIAG